MITGASSGIGRGLALEMAKRGARLGLLARREDLLDQLVEEVQAAGSQALALPVNVQDEAAVREAVERLRTEFGPIDILVANAGVGGNSEALKLTAAEFSNVIGVNVLGVVNCVTAVIPDMVAQG